MIEQENNISKISTLFQEQVETVSNNSRIGGKTEAEKFQPETRTENNIDEIKAYHTKSINSEPSNQTTIHHLLSPY